MLQTSALKELRVKGFIKLPSVFPVEMHENVDGAMRVRAELERFARQLGEPSVRDGGRVVWDVQPRPTQHRPTFSERAGEALPHTDSSYWDVPERWVLLYCLRPATDGGASYALDSQDFLALAAEVSGELLEQLHHCAVEWPAPAIFQTGLPPVSSPVVRGQIFRWRDDSISQAVSQPWVSRVREVMTEVKPAFNDYLCQGDLLILDNWRMLHARTDFQDPGRHFLRVRVHDDSL